MLALFIEVSLVLSVVDMIDTNKYLLNVKEADNSLLVVCHT